MRDPIAELHDLIDAATAGRAVDALSAVRQARRMLIWIEAFAVDTARAEGWSWAAMSRVAGVSKQALHRRHAGRGPVSSEPPLSPADEYDRRLQDRDAAFARLQAELRSRPAPPAA